MRKQIEDIIRLLEAGNIEEAIRLVKEAKPLSKEEQEILGKTALRQIPIPFIRDFLIGKLKNDENE